jgi:hypothetical protein
MVLPSLLIFSLYRAKGLGDRARDLWRDFDPNKTPRMLLPTLLVSLSPHGMAWHFFLRVVSTWATFSPTHPAAPRRGFTKRLQRGPHTGRGAKPVGLVDNRTRRVNLKSQISNCDRTRSHFSATLKLHATLPHCLHPHFPHRSPAPVFQHPRQIPR